MSTYNFIDGEVLLLNKPLNWTSFDVVAKIRNVCKKHLNVKKLKVGHAGTLDPLADGLLIVCTGKKTKIIDSIQAQTKTYTGTFKLGGTTPSYDLETEIDKTFPIDHITDAMIIEAANDMTGIQQQLPPVFSAKRVDGVRAYELARKGEQVALKKREVNIKLFSVSRIDNSSVAFEIVCSKGTYIRSIAHDFGANLNSGAHLTSLRRTAIGDFSLNNAITVEEFIAQLK